MYKVLTQATPTPNVMTDLFTVPGDQSFYLHGLQVSNPAFIYVKDTFTDEVVHEPGSNPTLLTAHMSDFAWTQKYFTNTGWYLQGSQALPPEATSGLGAYAVQNTGSANVVCKVDIAVPNAAFFNLGLVVRAAVGGWYTVLFRQNNTPVLGIYEVDANNVATLRASVPIPNCVGTTVTLTVVCNGPAITSTINTGETCTYGAATRNQTSTYHGMFQFLLGSNFVPAAMDNLLITGIGGDMTTTYGLVGPTGGKGGPYPADAVDQHVMSRIKCPPGPTFIPIGLVLRNQWRMRVRCSATATVNLLGRMV